MSWSRFFNNVEIEGSLDPYKWYGGRGVDAMVGAGRMEIDGDFLSGEEISNFRYRLLVVMTAYEVAKARGQNYPKDIDIATAKKIVDQTLEKRGVSVVGAGRLEIDGDFLSGEEISNFRYRLLVVMTAYEVAKARGQNYPKDIDIATAKKIVDQTLEKRGVSVVGAGRMEIDGDSLSDEEINDLQYRVLVMMAARQIARERGESSPGTSDIAMAQKIVDQTLEKRGISRTHSF
jgi:galactitol-specific phosphotransferase system IIB component